MSRGFDRLRPNGDVVLSPSPFSPFALSLSKGPCHGASTGSARTEMWRPARTEMWR